MEKMNLWHDCIIMTKLIKKLSCGEFTQSSRKGHRNADKFVFEMILIGIIAVEVPRVYR